jgi:hypothetical protein
VGAFRDVCGQVALAGSTSKASSVVRLHQPSAYSQAIEVLAGGEAAGGFVLECCAGGSCFPHLFPSGFLFSVSPPGNFSVGYPAAAQRSLTGGLGTCRKHEPLASIWEPRIPV